MAFIKRAFLQIFLSFFIILPLSSWEPQSFACDCQPHYAPIEFPSVIVEPPRIQEVQKVEKIVRAAIDIGSGATKLRVAVVNLNTRKVEQILVNQFFPVHYQEHLSKSADNTFDAEVMQAGIDAIKKSQQIAHQHNAPVIAVATASFRKAANSQEFIDRIYRETGILVYIIDQELEGKLAFNAVLSQGNYDPQKLIVWDIGGGSLQLIAQDNQGGYQVFRGEIASVPFKNIIIKDIQHKDINQVTTPNPLSATDIQQGLVKAREIAKRVDQAFKDRIQQPHIQVVGVGNIFAYGIYPIVGKKLTFSQSDLNQAIQSLEGKTDAQIGDEYANVLVSNSILVLGYMQALNIPQMHILDVNNADEAVLYPDFWRDKS